MKIQFRFPIEQSGPREVTIVLPTGNVPLLNPRAVELLALTPGESQIATDAAIRAIAVVGYIPAES